MTDDTPIDVDQMMKLEDIKSVEQYFCDQCSDEYSVCLIEKISNTACLASDLADQLEVVRAYYAQRDQRQREALQNFVNKVDAGQARSIESYKEMKAALASHPADNDASVFVEKITNDKIAELEAENERLRSAPDFLSEALNSGDGTYKP